MKLYNPGTQETIDADGADVQTNLSAGYLIVGNRPESAYMGKTREEILSAESGDADDSTPSTAVAGDLTVDSGGSEGSKQSRSQSKA